MITSRLWLGAALLAGVPFACTLAPATRDTAPPDMGGASMAITADGQVEAWEERSAPQARSFHAMAYDADRKETLVFGGEAPSGFALGTWVWNGSWKRRTPATTPSPRARHALTYDRDKRRVLLFGGSTSAGLSSESWSWDGQNWALLSPTTKPPGRYSATMAYDEVRRVSVLFGGWTNGGALADTWTFDGTNWKQEAPAVKPPGDRNAVMVYDSARSMMLLAVQAPGTSCPIALWRWTGTNWEQPTVMGAGPSVCGFTATFDKKEGVLVAHGYTNQAPAYPRSTWTFNGTSWTNTTPGNAAEGRQGGSITFDESRGETLAFGGVNVGGVPRQSARLERRSGANWVVDPSTTPGFRYYGALAQAPNNALVLFGGLVNGPIDDTWTFDAKGWAQEQPTIRPTGRYRCATAFDERRNLTILFGGIGTNGYRNDTWTWNGTSWTQVVTPHSPANVDGTLTYDPIRDRAFLFDGNTSPLATWAFDGQDWTRAPTPDAPSRRNHASVAYDRVRGVTVMFGGTGDIGAIDDTLTWDGVKWTALTPIDRPAPRWGASIAWDDVRKQLVLFGGYSQNNTLLNDVWTWNGQNWTSLVDPKATNIPTPRYYGSLQPIGKTGNLLLFGGQDDRGAIEDQWVFRTRGGACTTAAECGSGNCVDGVCCESSACGTCETCGGTDRGVCESVRNAEDPDTCRAINGSRCNAEGKCSGGAGATCKTGADCSTGFCVDGFCCNTSCALPCEACAASTKSVASEDGRCGPAKVGTNPGGRCSAKDLCNASGACESRTEATCATDSVLDVGDGTTQDCSPYTCRVGACTKSCASYKDCTFPASCNEDGRCEVRGGVVQADGCSAGGASRSSWLAYGVVALALAARRRRRLFLG